MLLGTARGEIQLLTARRMAGLWFGYDLGDEFEGIAIALDAGGAEMPANHQRRRIGETREQFAPRHG
jgi:hypothetical protein